MSERIFNFSAGPAVLPEAVLETVKSNILSYDNSGLGVMELSHRGKHFKGIIEGAEAELRKLLEISDDYSVVFTTGGASNQFSMIPMNLLSSSEVGSYIVTGSWAKKALKEAKKFGETHLAASSEDKNFNYIPTQVEVPENAAYLHYTSNNTIAGTQYKTEPNSDSAPLICDASSDFLHKKIDVNKYGLIYAGAQKNIGPAGVTLVIIRKDLLERCPESLPTMMNYKTYTENASLYNTPPAFPIYVVWEVLKWISAQGGLAAIEKNNEEKAGLLYSALEEQTDFYELVTETDSRSLMNVVFRLKDHDLESTFIEEAAKEGLNGLKGHRSVGGIRASIYNAFPKAGVQKLVSFMKEFAARN